MFIKGDIFKIKGREYILRHINQYNTCWLEPVLYRDRLDCVSGGLNEVFHMDELVELEYLNSCYSH